MSLIADNFAEFVNGDLEDDEDVPFGDALEELAVDIAVDTVAEVRDVRERL